jgi:hypothetical protein
MAAGSLVQPRSFSPSRAEILELHQRRFPTLARIIHRCTNEKAIDIVKLCEK